MVYVLCCLSYHSKTEAVLFACLQQAGPPQRGFSFNLETIFFGEDLILLMVKIVIKFAMKQSN